MKRLTLALLMLISTMPLLAQRRVDLIVDVEGERRTGHNTGFTPGVTFDPRFGTSGGIGVGLNFFTSDRVSIEAKVAALQSNLRVRTVGTDFIANVDLGEAQIYPLSAILQWHMTEHGTIRPYVGAGLSYVVLRNISKEFAGATGIRFKDPAGLVVDGGLEFNLSKRWSLLGDARYIPIETNSKATFTGTNASVRMHVRPLIVSFGAAWRF